MDQHSSHTETSVSSIVECEGTSDADPTTALLACRQILERSQTMDVYETALLTPLARDLETGNAQRQEQAYFNVLVRFFYNSLVPDRYRSYFAAHPATAALAMIIAFGSIGLVLYYSGNLVMLGMYIKLVLCFLFGGVEGDDGPFKFCWA